MDGPSTKGLKNTGSHGRHKSNIKRDMIRKVGNVVPWMMSMWLHALILGLQPKTIILEYIYDM